MSENDKEHEDHEEEGELVPADEAPEMLEVTESNQSGNDAVEVLFFDIVISPGSSITALYQVVVKEPKGIINELTVSFVRTQDGTVVDTVAGTSINNPGHGVNGALDVLPSAFKAVEGDGASCILSGWVGKQGFFFRQPVDILE